MIEFAIGLVIGIIIGVWIAGSAIKSGWISYDGDRFNSNK